MIIEMGDITFANNLVYLRKKYQLSRRALANLIGVSSDFLREIENGTGRPALQLDAFDRICEVFHIYPNDLVHTDMTLCDNQREMGMRHPSTGMLVRQDFPGR